MSNTATTALDIAYARGHEARTTETINAPSMDAWVREQWADAKPGATLPCGYTAVEVMTAWGKGWDHANNAIADALLD